VWCSGRCGDEVPLSQFSQHANSHALDHADDAIDLTSIPDDGEDVPAVAAEGGTVPTNTRQGSGLTAGARASGEGAAATVAPKGGLLLSEWLDEIVHRGSCGDDVDAFVHLVVDHAQSSCSGEALSRLEQDLERVPSLDADP